MGALNLEKLKQAFVAEEAVLFAYLYGNYSQAHNMSLDAIAKKIASIVEKTG